MMAPLDPRIMARLDSKVQRRGEDDCWPWLGLVVRSTPHMAYAKVPAPGRTQSGSPRRLVWERFYGTPPDKRFSITFSCSNLLCMNPRHMRNRSVEERFWALVNKAGPTRPHMESQCWVWLGRKLKGYGQFNPIENKHWVAHRYAWELVHGEIPRDGVELCVLHRCDNPACVRTDHHFLGTDADNIADMIAKGRNSRGARHSEIMRKVRERAKQEKAS